MPEGHGRSPEMRISDDERERVVTLLQQHVRDGRLDLDEFSDRVDQVYRARTAPDLQEVLVDLPAAPEQGSTVPASPPAVRDERAERARRGVRDHVGRYLIVNAFLIGIWLLTGAGYFWPIWPLLGWGVGVAIHAWRVYGVGDVRDDDDA